MSVNLTVNGTTYAYPSTGDEQWGTVATNWASAVTSGMLQKAGGTFTLTADANFGASFGLLAAYFSTRSSTPSTAGQFRMANADTGIGWRNAANSGNLLLTVDSSNRLTYNGIVLSGSSALTASRVMATDASGFPTVATTTTTQVQYLASATGSTGTASTNIVFSASPTLTGTVTFSALQSSSSNVATAGSLRLSNTEAIDWRNAANSANAALAYSASDRLTLDGVNIPTISSTDTLTNKTLTSPTINGATVSGTFTGALTFASAITFSTSTTAPFHQTDNSNNATTGFIRLPNTNVIAWRNAANSANHTVQLNASDLFEFSAGLTSTTYVASTSFTSPNFSTSSSNKATAGVVRLANTDQIEWRNAANSANTTLIVNSSDQLEYTTTSSVCTLGLSGCSFRGTTTNDSAAAGYVGQYTESVVAAGTSIPNATTQYGDLTSISLTAGDWDVTAVVSFVANGATVTAFDIGISTTSGNSGTGLAYGNNEIDFAGGLTASAAFTRMALVLPSYRVSIASTTTHYLKLYAAYTVATPQYGCRLSARRVR